MVECFPTYNLWFDPRSWEHYKLLLMPFKMFKVTDKDRAFFETALDRAAKIKSSSYVFPDALKNKKIGLLFFEPSSRTRWSFEKACLNLGLTYMSSVVDSNTSASKGESPSDTYSLYKSYGFDLIIMRSKAYQKLEDKIEDPKNQHSFINAGFGEDSHPTQALLDVFTWKETAKKVNIKLLIVGDIKHSRVARSHLRLAQIMGYEVALLPFEKFELSESELKEFKPKRVFKNRVEALDWAEVVMCLRAQKERFVGLSGEDYRPEPLKKEELKQSHLIMHPGPFIRDEDLASDLVEDKRSLIFKQVENSVYCRSSLISLALEYESDRIK